jgi:hypothetical protein
MNAAVGALGEGSAISECDILVADAAPLSEAPPPPDRAMARDFAAFLAALHTATEACLDGHQITALSYFSDTTTNLQSLFKRLNQFGTASG